MYGLASGGFANTRNVLIFLGDEGDEKAACGALDLFLSPLRLRDFLVEREVKKTIAFSVRPTQKRLHPR